MTLRICTLIAVSLTLAACRPSDLPTKAELEKLAADVRAGKAVVLAYYCAAPVGVRDKVLTVLRAKTGMPGLTISCGAGLVPGQAVDGLVIVPAS